MAEYGKDEGRRLLVGCTDERARKDTYNRDKGIRRLEKAYRRGSLTKGYNNTNYSAAKQGGGHKKLC